MKCSKIQDYFSSYYDGGLSEKEKASIEEHLSQCGLCRKDYEAFKNAIAALAGLGDIKAPEDIFATVNRRIDRSRRKESLIQRLLFRPAQRAVPQLVTVSLFVVLGIMLFYMYGAFKNLSDVSDVRRERTATLEVKPEPSSDYRSTITMRDGEGLKGRASISQPEEELKLAYSGKEEVRGKDMQIPRGLYKRRSGVSDDDIEIVPCSKSPKDMNKKIERLALLSNGQIVRTKTGNERGNELLIQVPINTYASFIRRLKEVVGQKRIRAAKSEDFDVTGRLGSSLPGEVEKEQVSKLGKGTGLRGVGTGGGGEFVGVGPGGLGQKGNGLGSHGTGRADWGGRGEAGVTASIEEDEFIVKGEVNPVAIEKIIRFHLGYLKWCYEKELNMNPELEGKIVVDFVINAQGIVTSSKIKESGMTGKKGGKDVETCVAGRIKRIKFPRPESGVAEVFYPFIFKTEKGLKAKELFRKPDTSKFAPSKKMLPSEVPSTTRPTPTATALPEVKLIRVIYE